MTNALKAALTLALALTIAAMGLSTAALAQPYCTDAEGAAGFTSPGSECVTETVYDENFADPYATFDAMEYLFGVPSAPLAPAVDETIDASDRPREFEGEELSTVDELLQSIMALLKGFVLSWGIGS